MPIYITAGIRKKGYYLSTEQRLQNLLQHTRFLLTFDQELNISMEQVPTTCCAIDPKNEKQAMLFIDEWVPIELIPDLMVVGLQRLSRQFK